MDFLEHIFGGLVGAKVWSFPRGRKNLRMTKEKLLGRLLDYFLNVDKQGRITRIFWVDKHEFFRLFLDFWNFYSIIRKNRRRTCIDFEE